MGKGVPAPELRVWPPRKSALAGRDVEWLVLLDTAHARI